MYVFLPAQKLLCVIAPKVNDVIVDLGSQLHTAF